jgi:hypothetical protein
MGDFDPAFIQTLAQQSWALYAVGMFLILLRMFDIPLTTKRLSLLTHVPGTLEFTN